MQYRDAGHGSQRSRSRALDWPYPRRVRFERELQRAVAVWFGTKGLRFVGPGPA
jgi:hypothetical protein